MVWTGKVLICLKSANYLLRKPSCCIRLWVLIILSTWCSPCSIERLPPSTNNRLGSLERSSRIINGVCAHCGSTSLLCVRLSMPWESSFWLFYWVYLMKSSFHFQRSRQRFEAACSTNWLRYWRCSVNWNSIGDVLFIHCEKVLRNLSDTGRTIPTR